MMQAPREENPSLVLPHRLHMYQVKSTQVKTLSFHVQASTNTNIFSRDTTDKPYTNIFSKGIASVGTWTMILEHEIIVMTYRKSSSQK